MTLTNVPAITDVETMLELAADLGAEVEHGGAGEVRISGAGISKFELDEELCSRIRASILFSGPLLAKHGRAVVPPPGGDVIGRRRLDTHIHALIRLGADIRTERVYLHMQTAGLRGAHVFLDEASVTGTENVVIAAVLASGETVIGNAACEPHVQDLCRFLVSLGAQIEGIGSNVLRIRGVESLRGGEWRICPDHIEVASFIGLAAVTEGDLTIEDIVAEDLVAIWPGFDRLGISWEVDGSSVHVRGGKKLVVRDDIGSQIPKIEDGPWPAFPADLTSIALAVATQAEQGIDHARLVARQRLAGGHLLGVGAGGRLHETAAGDLVPVLALVFHAVGAGQALDQGVLAGGGVGGRQGTFGALGGALLGPADDGVSLLPRPIGDAASLLGDATRLANFFRHGHTKLVDELENRGLVERSGRTPAAGRETGEWRERAENDRERALAAGQLGEQRPLDLRDPDLDHVGLRYEDKDKPGG